ncbi:hypothetical protein ACV229_40215 [Burkholderia sp. MR1-5-21]
MKQRTQCLQLILLLRSASTPMFSNKHPEFRRPAVGPRRSTWPYRFAELFFGTLAKATMVVALLLYIAVELFSAGTGAGTSISNLPTTRRGWRYLFLVLLLIFMLIVGYIYLFSPAWRHFRL